MGKKEKEIYTVERKREKDEDNIDDSYCLRWTRESKADIGFRRHAWSCGTEFRGVFTWRRPKSRLPAQFQTQAGTPTRAPTHRTLPPTRPTYSPSQNSLDVGSFLPPFSHVSPNQENLSNNSSRGNIFFIGNLVILTSIV